MYRTNALLFKYFVPALLILGTALALWKVAIPWYVPLVLIPLGMVVSILAIGKAALAKEHREPKQDFHTEDRWNADRSNGAEPSEVAHVKPIPKVTDVQ